MPPCLCKPLCFAGAFLCQRCDAIALGVPQIPEHSLCPKILLLQRQMTKHPLAAKLHTSPLPHAIFSQNPEASNNPWHGWQPTEKKKQKGDKPLCAVLQGAANQQIYCKGDC